MSSNIDEKDRPSDVAILPDGRLVVMVETSPDARDTSNPQKTFVQIYWGKAHTKTYKLL